MPFICGWSLLSGYKGIVYGWTGIVRDRSLKAGTDGHLFRPPITRWVRLCNCPWGADEVAC